MREFYQIVMNITGTFVFLIAGVASGSDDKVVRGIADPAYNPRGVLACSLIGDPAYRRNALRSAGIRRVTAIVIESETSISAGN